MTSQPDQTEVMPEFCALMIMDSYMGSGASRMILALMLESAIL